MLPLPGPNTPAVWAHALCARGHADVPTGLPPADLAPIYEHLCSELGWQPDAARLAAMRAANATALEEHDAKIKDAEENLGETEVRDALAAKAEYLGRVGDRAAAAEAFQRAEEKTASGGAKADMIFSQTRCKVVVVPSGKGFARRCCCPERGGEATGTCLSGWSVRVICSRTSWRCSQAAMCGALRGRQCSTAPTLVLAAPSPGWRSCTMTGRV